jgi:hypothetical protein
MTERDYVYDKLVPRIIEERLTSTRHHKVPGQRRGRRAIATGLHHLANRLDG